MALAAISLSLIALIFLPHGEYKAFWVRISKTITTDKNNPEDVDTHAEDHAYDALRYGCMSRPVHPIRQDFIDKTNEPKHIAPADRVFGY